MEPRRSVAAWMQRTMVTVSREAFDQHWAQGWSALMAASGNHPWPSVSTDSTQKASDNYAVVYEGRPGVVYLHSQGW